MTKETRNPNAEARGKTLRLARRSLSGEVGTNCTNFHELVLSRVIRLFRKLDLSAASFEIQGSGIFRDSSIDLRH